MPLLSFDVYSNYEEVARLRSEITMLENRLKSFGPGTSITTIRAVEAQLQSARAKFRGLALDAAQAGASLEMNIRKGVNGAIAAVNDLQQKLTNPIQGLTQIAGVAGLGLFLNQVSRIRGQFQLMETNINTLLGSAEKGQAMMAELTEYAKVSPLDFQGTVGAAQMMLGFGIEQSKVLPFMKALGDVSMGNAQRFQSLTLAFSQMSAAGKLMGQDLMQMVNAGFQPLDQLAKDTGKSIGQLKDEMSQGKISAEMVQQAFINATSEGGKFFNMSKSATATISGQMSMLGDASDLMFNDLGKKSEDAIIKVIEGATWMVENYEKVGGVLGTAIATFGIYKASAMASEFAIKAASEERSKAVVQGFEEEIAKMEEYQRQRALMEFDDDVRGALETGAISSDMAQKIQAMREEIDLRKEAAESAVKVAEQEVLAANNGLKAAQQKLADAHELVDAAEQIGDANDQAAAAEGLLSAQMEYNAAATNLLNAETNLNTANRELNTATTQANTIAQIQQSNATNANTSAQNINTASIQRGRVATALATASRKVATVVQYGWNAAVNAGKKAFDGLKIAFMSNPFGLIITALTTGIGLFLSFKDEITGFVDKLRGIDAATKELSNTFSESQKNIDSEQAAIDRLFNKLRSLSSGTEEYKEVKDTIISQYGQYLKGLIDERNNLLDVETAYYKVSAAARDAANARALADYSKEADDDYAEKLKEEMEAIESILSSISNKGVKDAILRLIRNDIDKNGFLSEETRNLVAESFGEKRLKSGGFQKSSKTAEISKRVQSISVAKRRKDENISKATGMFGEQKNEFESWSKDALDAFAAELQNQIDAGETSFMVMANGTLMEYKSKAEALVAMGKVVELAGMKKEEADKKNKENLEFKFNEAKKELTVARAELEKIKSNRANYTEKQYKDAVDRVSSAESAFKKLGGDTAKDDIKQRAYELRKVQLEEEKRTAELLQAEKNRQREFAIAQMGDNSEKEIETIKFTAEKKRQALERELQKEADILEKNALQEWLKGGKNRREYQYYAQYSETQLKEMREGYLRQARNNVGYNTQSALITNNESSELQKIYRSGAEAMLHYLKDFGTFQQKRFAIERDYSEKIANARNEGERLSFESQRKSELHKLDIEALKQQIDWGSMFGDFGAMLSDQVQPTIDKLEAITKSEKFRDSTFEEQKAVYELISTLKGTITEWDSNIYSVLGDAVSVYQSALRENADAIDAESKARKIAEEKALKLQNIEEKNRIAKEKGEQADVEAENIARQESKEAVTDLGVAASRTTQTTSNLAAAQQNLSNATTKTKNMFSQLVSGLQGLASGSLQGVWNGLNQLSKLFAGNENLANKLGDSLLKGMQILFGDDSKIGQEVSKALSAIGGPMMGEIVGMFFSILDILKDGIGNFVASLIDTVLGAVNGLLNSVLSGEIITSIGKSVIQNVGNILDTVSFGGFSSLMNSLGLSGESDKNLEKDIERLTATNDVLRRAMDNLANEMREAATAEMGVLYQQQKDDLQASMKNTQEMMSRSGAAYSNGFLGVGGHKSSNHKINEGMNGNDWTRISDIVGRSVGSAGDFWTLTSEQMAKVAKSAPDLYVKIKGLADDGYKNASQFMDEYIQYYKELEELENAFRESLTDVSLDSVKDEFKSMLLDMESDTEDFTNNFEKMMQQAVVNSLMNSKYNDKIKEWYNAFSDAMNDNDSLTVAEQERLKKQWDNIVGDAVNDRDNLKKAMGWDSSSTQQASSRTLAGMSQDTGNAIEGRLTALQIAVESIRTSEAQHTMSLADLNDELLQIAMEYSRFNVHQDNIERQLAKIYIELQTISENTGAIVKPIQTMQADIAEIKKNTKNL